MNSHTPPTDMNRAVTLLEEAGRILRGASVPTVVPDFGQMPNPGTPSGRAVQDGITSLARFRQALPHGTAFSSVAGTSAAAREELQQNFQPYSANRNTPTGSGRNSGARSRIRTREWAHPFFCLAGPSDTKTPTNARKIVLQNAGLGAKVVRIRLNASSQALANQIRDLYPRLRDFRFQLLKSEGGGGGGKMLSPIGNGFHSIPTPEDVMLLVGRTLVYIKPIINIFEEDDESTGALDTDNTEAPQNYNNSEDRDVDDSNPSLIISGNTPSASPAPTDNLASAAFGEILKAQSQGYRTQIKAPVLFSDGELLSVSDFRSQLYLENPGIQPIFIQRDNFVEAVIGVYKDPSFDLRRKPQIIFAGEAGTDVGALQKEFFWRGISAIRTGRLGGRLAFFEGEEDHKIPTCDSVLLRSGVFKTLGKFMAHGAIHCGLAFVGLSPAVVDYLVTGNVDIDTPLTLSINDIPDVENRHLLKKISEWGIGAMPSVEDRVKIDNFAYECDFNETVTGSNCTYLYQHILHHIVIWKRKPQLDEMKLAFEETSLLNFLQGRRYLLGGLFPSGGGLVMEPSIVVSKIESAEASELVQHVKDFITLECRESAKLGELLSAWTGWALIPDEPLTVKIADSGEFCFHSCFQELEIPDTFTREDVFAHMARVLTYGTVGFGST